MSSSPAPTGTLTQGPASASPGLDALLHRAAFAPIPNVGWLRITGSDRVRWLNGMVTNNIAALKPGEGNYNFFLNAQGRIQGDCTAFMQPDSILLQTAADRIPALITLLDHFIIMDDVELTLVPLEGVAIIGPEAPSVLNQFVPGTEPALLEMIEFKAAGYNGICLRSESPHVPRFEVWFDTPGAPRLASETWAGLAQATPQDLELLRILSGTPLYGTDIRDKDLPQETNQDLRALHFAKGCYLGQEIVERIRSRGAVHRTFTGFLLSGDPATPGTILTVDGKPVGELTSVASFNSQLTTYNSQLALGYLRREVLTRPTSIQYPGGIATPSALPFTLTP